MADKKDTDPQSLRAARDHLSAIGVRLDDMESRLHDNDLAHKVLDVDILDIRTCCAAVLTAINDLELKMIEVTAVMAAGTSKQISKQPAGRISVGLTKSELTLILLAIVLIMVAVAVSVHKYLR